MYRELRRVPRGLPTAMRTTSRVPCALTGEMTDGSIRITLVEKKEQVHVFVSKGTLRALFHLALHGLQWWSYKGIYTHQIELGVCGSLAIVL